MREHGDPTGTSAREAFLGIFFILVGSGFAWEASLYPLGSARDMGPGYFPLYLGLFLAAIGLLIATRALPRLAGWHWRSEAKAIARSRLWPLSLALLVFGFAVEYAGLFPSTAALVLATSAASQTFRWRSALVWALAVAAFCSLLFVGALGLQLPVWPAFIA